REWTPSSRITRWNWRANFARSRKTLAQREPSRRFRAAAGFPAATRVFAPANVQANLDAVAGFPTLARLADEQGVGPVVVGHAAFAHVVGQLFAHQTGDVAQQHDLRQPRRVIDVTAG